MTATTRTVECRAWVRAGTVRSQERGGDMRIGTGSATGEPSEPSAQIGGRARYGSIGASESCQAAPSGILSTEGPGLGAGHAGLGLIVAAAAVCATWWAGPAVGYQRDSGHRPSRPLAYAAVGIPDPPEALAWSPSGRYIATESHGVLVLWNTRTGRPVRSLRVGSFQGLAWSRHGHILATSSDGEVVLWDPNSGRRRSVLPGSYSMMAWAPNGHMLAIQRLQSSRDALVLWHVGSAGRGTGVTVVKVRGDRFQALAWSPDGRTLAVAHQRDGPSRLLPGPHPLRAQTYVNGTDLIDARTGRVRATLSGHRDLITQLAWSPDGRTLASGSADKTVMLWDAARRHRRRTLTTSSAVERMAWSPSGRALATLARESGAATLWNPRTGRRRATLVPRANYRDGYNLAWSPDGRSLAVGMYAASIIWDAARLRTRLVLPATWGPAWNPAGTMLVTGACDATAVLWDAVRGVARARLVSHVDPLGHLAWRHDGRAIALDYVNTHQVCFDDAHGADMDVMFRCGIVSWNLTTGELRPTGYEGAVSLARLAWSPVGKYLAGWVAAVTWSGAVAGSLTVLWHAAGHAPARVISGVGGPLQWSPAGEILAADARLWDANGRPRPGFVGARKPWDWSPDGRSLATGSADGRVLLWNASTGELRASLTSRSGPVTLLAWSPDGQTLASAAQDGGVTLWDMAAGKPRATLTALGGSPFRIAWEPDGLALAVIASVPHYPGRAGSDSDDTATLWDARTARRRAVLFDHAPGPVLLAWRPRGGEVATSAGFRGIGGIVERGKVATIWNAATGRPRGSIVCSQGGITGLQWSPDGGRLATRPDGQTVTLWDSKALKVRARLASPAGAIQGLGWSPDGSRLAAATAGGAVGLWNGATGAPLATLYVLDRGQNWLVVTPEGYFAGSPGGVRLVEWRRGNRLWPLKRFRRRFERPDLVRRALAGLPVTGGGR